jgi:hypothetical protein
VPYETTDVNALTKGEIKAWSGGYRKVPIAVLAGEQVNDSPVIAQTLMDRMGTSGVLSEQELAAFRSPKALEWAEWSDKQLAVLLFPNITRNFGEAYEAFGYVMDVPHFSLTAKWSNQIVGSFFMWMAQGKIKKKCAPPPPPPARRPVAGHRHDARARARQRAQVRHRRRACGGLWRHQQMGERGRRRGPVCGRRQAQLCRRVRLRLLEGHRPHRRVARDHGANGRRAVVRPHAGRRRAGERVHQPTVTRCARRTGALARCPRQRGKPPLWKRCRPGEIGGTPA